ncbi:MAG: ABC transporter permease [Lactobacillales bacterium]|jgi:putative ABC transport system permease protein|nr:ABC transporter permease [Lactobacillales bacterium]
MKFFDLMKTAVSNLSRSKSRTILTIIAVFIGAFTIAITVGLNIGINRYVTQQIEGVGDENSLIIQANYEKNRASGSPQEYNPNKNVEDYILNSEDVKKIKNIQGIDEISTISDSKCDYVSGKNGKRFVINTQFDVGVKNQIEIGKAVNQKATEPEIVLTTDYVKALGYKNSKEVINKEVKVAVTSQTTGEQTVFTAKIVGIRKDSLIQAGSSLVNKVFQDKVIKIHETGLPEKLRNQNYAVVAKTKTNISKEEMAKLKERVEKQGYEAQTVDDQIGSIRNVVNAVTGVLILFGAIALLAATFGIVNTLFMSVQERTREIGLMKAIGLSRHKVFLLFSFEAILIGFIGSCLGVLVAFGLGSSLNAFASSSFLKGLDGLTLISFSPIAVFGIIGLIMLIAFIAGTLPARRASKLNPIKALSYE